MKFQPRRFVVEVKRGTSRSAFTSPDSVSEKFSSAEELLFGGPAKPIAVQPTATKAVPPKPAGRVLESLVEPPAPAVEDLPERPRRGRKPGSKNKPKIPAFQTTPAPTASTTAPTPRRVEAATVPARPVFAEDERERRPPVVLPAQPVAAPSSADEVPAEARPGRSRLRDRSSILKRYVLGTEPRPGQQGYLRARRAARTR